MNAAVPSPRPTTVAIIGYGVEGKVAAEYWGRRRAAITICDANPDLVLPAHLRAGAHLGDDPVTGVSYLAGLGNLDLIVRSPGTRPDAILRANPLFPGLAGRITSSTREFFAYCPAPIIGVTGTKGKGTTATLITRILEAAGRHVHLGGNIGTPPLEFLPQVRPSDLVVLELSSFQLIDLDRSPQVAVCLMIAPDHLDWHIGMDEYVDAKSQLFRHQSPRDLAISKAGDPASRRVAAASPGRQLLYGAAPGARVADGHIVIDGTTICAVADVALPGSHNLENVCAAITAVWDLVGRDSAPIRAAITAFAGLPHRLQRVAEVAGVSYYDDSFSTNPATAIAAIHAFTQPKVLILGGSDKGASYADLAQAVARGGVIHALLIGDTAPAIERALRRAGFTHLTTGIADLQRLVETCYHITEPGDVVLLSPACASFGLFTDYQDRGDQFQAAVRSLAARVQPALPISAKEPS